MKKRNTLLAFAVLSVLLAAPHSFAAVQTSEETRTAEEAGMNWKQSAETAGEQPVEEVGSEKQKLSREEIQQQDKEAEENEKEEKRLKVLIAVGIAVLVVIPCLIWWSILGMRAVGLAFSSNVDFSPANHLVLWIVLFHL